MSIDNPYTRDVICSDKMPSNNKIMRDNSSGRCQSHDQTNENRHPNARQSRNLPPNETKNSQSFPSILSSNGKEHTPKSYKLGVQLGSGSFASVYLAREWPSNTKVAVKLIHFQGNATPAGGREETRYDSGGRETTVLEMIQCEIDIHKSLSSTSLCGTQQQLQPQPQYPQHPNIVQFYDSFQLDKECFQTMIATTATNAPARLHYALVTEYCPGGDLSSYLKRIRDERRHDNVAVPTGESSQWDDRKSTLLTEREIRHALSEVLAGLSFLHSRGIIHRDIKASNIFLSPTTSARTDNNVDFRPNHHGMRHPSLAKTQNNEGLNLLQYRLKIGDFGLSVQLRDDDDWYEAQTTLCGTPSCIAPEVVMAASSTSPYAEGLCMENCGNFGGVDRVGVGEAPISSCCGIDDSVFPSFDGDTDTVLILARHEKSSRRHQRGSRKYDPTNDPHNGRNAQNGGVTGYGQPADLWSTGCLLYTMIVGKNPFACPIRQNVSNPQKQINPSVDANEEKAERIRQTIQRILRLDWSVPSHLRMSSQLESLLHKLLSKDPKMRGSARSILSFHPFFNTEKENAQPLRELDTDVLLAKTSTVKTTHASNSIKEGGSMGAKGTEKYQQPAPNHGNSDVNILPTNRNDSISSKSASLSAKSSWSNKVSNDLHEGNMNKISPMKGLQRLPASKYTIAERSKTTATYSHFDSTIDRKRCKVFFLGKHGLVIQHEHDGDWMHVTSDGLYFIAGEMTLNSVMHDNGAINRQSHYEDHTALLNEAFLHAPSDLFPSTTRSMYRPISFLSHANNSRFLPLYRTLENAVQSMKSSTPMITIYLHTSNAPGPGNDHTYRLFAKSTMMENYPIPDVEIAFVDGTTIRFLMSTGDVSIAVKPIDMRVSKEMKLEARIDPNLMHPSSVVTSDSFSSCILDSNRMMHDYLRHLNMMRAAAWECFDIIERSSAGERDPFPIVRKLVANCSQRDKWQIIKSH